MSEMAIVICSVMPAVLGDAAPLLVRVTGLPRPGAHVLLTVRAPVMAWPAPDGGDVTDDEEVRLA